MKTIMEGDEKYSKLELVDVVYGDDEPQKSTDQTAALLQNYKDLKVICAPTTVGIAAAAKYLQDNGSSCKLTGLDFHLRCRSTQVMMILIPARTSICGICRALENSVLTQQSL